MAWQQSDLDALNSALAQGVSKVRYGDGREVTYRTLAEMRALRGDIIASLTSPAQQPLTRIVGGYRSGLS